MDKDFPEILRDYVSEQRQKNPSVNETSISKKMDIPPTTFNRLVNGHSKPAVKTLLKLSQFIPQLRNSFPKEISQILQVTLERENREYIEETLETLLSDKYLFLCWAFSFSEKGITEEDIIKSFGQQGRVALETLVKKNIVSKNESNLYKVIEKNKDIILSFHLIKTHFLFLAEQYKPDNLSNNYIHYWVESINEEAKKKLLKAHKEFHRIVQKIMNDEDSKGNELVFSLACSDSLLEKELEQEI